MINTLLKKNYFSLKLATNTEKNLQWTHISLVKAQAILRNHEGENKTLKILIC